MAVVDVELILHLLNSELTSVGEWVNVIGYIIPRDKSEESETQDSNTTRVYIQAMMLWSTGPLDVRKYEESFIMNQEKAAD